MPQALNFFIAVVGVFGAFSAVVSTINEIWSNLRGTRELYLWWGIARLVGVRDPVRGGPMQRVAIRRAMSRIHQQHLDPRFSAEGLMLRLFDHPAIRALCLDDRVRSHPPHIPSDIFAAALTDIVMRQASGAAGPGVVVASAGLPEAVRRLPPDSALALLLQRALERSGGDRVAFETEVARAFDESMNRVTDWFKRSMQWQSVLVGMSLSAAIGLDAGHLARALLIDASPSSLAWPPPWFETLHQAVAQGRLSTQDARELALTALGTVVMGLAAFVGPAAWYQLLTALMPLKAATSAGRATTAPAPPDAATTTRMAVPAPSGNVLEALLPPDRIRQLQASLLVTPTGTLDPPTRDALRKAQQRLGEPIDGELSATLWTKVTGTPCAP